MRLGAFGHLAANRHHRIQRRHRLLKDHGNLAPAQPPQARRLPQQVDALESSPSPPLPPPPLPLHRATESPLRPAPPAPAVPESPAPSRFCPTPTPDQPQHFALVHLQADAAYRLDCAKTNVQIANVEQRAHAAIVEHQWLWCGVGNASVNLGKHRDSGASQ